jgi:hypothetical protein
MDESVPFGSPWYVSMLVLLAFARGADFLSTWVATPHLVLEGNPIAKWLGWKWGALVNIAICVGLAFWPLSAIIVATASVLVAARNFQSAWLMRTMGEYDYREWYGRRMAESRLGLYLVCLAGNTLLTAGVGVALIVCSFRWPVESDGWMIPLAIGMGIVAYATAVIVFTLLAVWRSRRAGHPNSTDNLRCSLPRSTNF